MMLDKDLKFELNKSGNYQYGAKSDYTSAEKMLNFRQGISGR
jgi:hypothetical protein